MQRLNLTPYGGPRDYERAFNANFTGIGRLGELNFFPALITLLADASGLDQRLVSLELKRYLMVCAQYFPASLAQKTSNAEIAGGLLLTAARSLFKSAPPAAILADVWYPGANDNFYGPELLSALGAGQANFSAYAKFSPAALGRARSALNGALSLKREILAAHGIDLGRFIYRFFSDWLTGQSLRGSGLKTVVSGNDNSFPVIKAAAAGARIALIQNGNRPLDSDTCFKSCDLYLAMGGEPFRQVMLDCGCEHGSYLPLGSLRLHNALGKGLAQAPACDIAYISPGLLHLFDAKAFKTAYFSLEAELETLRLVNSLPAAGYKVCYHPAYEGELETLEKRGLKVPGIDYADRASRGVYETISGASLALGTFTTAMLEALALGKRVALVNLHGNPCLNTAFAPLQVEYTGAGDFSAFIRHALAAPPPPGYAWQRGDYPAAVAAAVKGLPA